MAVASAQEFFGERLPKKIAERPQIIEKINAVYRFVIEGQGGGSWTVDLTQPGGKVTAGGTQGDCIITVAAPDFLAIMNGQLNAQMAFMTGKLKVAGDIAQALKLQYIFA